MLQEEKQLQKEELQKLQGRLLQEHQKGEELRYENLAIKESAKDYEAGGEAALQEVRLWGGCGEVHSVYRLGCALQSTRVGVCVSCGSQCVL